MQELAVSYRLYSLQNASLTLLFADYYSRYRPGLTGVVAGLLVFSCFIQYVYQYLTFRVQKMRIAAYVTFHTPFPRSDSFTSSRRFRTQALEAAWGPTKKALEGRKKLKVKMTEQGDPLGMPGINGGKPTGPGSVVEMVVEGENVYIVENRKGPSFLTSPLHSLRILLTHSPSPAETLLNEDSAVKPSFKSTWLPQQIIPYLPPSLVASISSKPKKSYKKPSAGGITSGEDSGTASDDATSGGEGTARIPRGPGKGIEGLGKVGGRRRKTVPRPAAKPETK